jgi:hypothetical protein
MSDKQLFVLAHQEARRRAMAAVANAPEGFRVKVEPPCRTLDQNAKFHAICGDLAKSGQTWAGKRRTLEQWKVLLVSGHSVATKHGAEMVPGLEGEFVNLRESTARMDKARSSSLLEYAIAFCATAGIYDELPA